MSIINPFIHLSEIHYDERPDLDLQPVKFEQVKKDRYLVSNYGDIYSLFYSKFLKPQYDKDGYNKIELATYGGHKKVFAHRLVAYTYVPNPNPELYNIVNHIDGNKKNNYYQNLEHCTEEYNREHAVRNGLMRHGEDNFASKFKEQNVRDICKMFEQGKTPIDIMTEYKVDGMSEQAIYDFARNVYKRYTWKHISCEYNF